MKEIIDKLDFIKIKNVCSVKNNVKRMRRQATVWVKIIVKYTINKELSSKIYKELLKLNNKKTNNLIRRWVKVFNRQLTKEDIWKTNKHMKNCFKSYDNKEMKLE